MDQLEDFSDRRLRGGCIFCGGPEETRDHVPSRVFLDQPFPENLPIVPACEACNNGFSADEEYLACLIEAAAAGTTDPSMMRRGRIADILRRAPKLRALIEKGRLEQQGQILYTAQDRRVMRVVEKLARGHAAYELGILCQTDPSQVACWPIHLMSPEEQAEFNEPYRPRLFGEVGSRGFQRALVTRVSLEGPNGARTTMGFLMNDWLEVQEGRYRYLAVDTPGEVRIRIVIGEYLAAQVTWSH